MTDHNYLRHLVNDLEELTKKIKDELKLEDSE
jgi:hypothetical protein